MAVRLSVIMVHSPPANAVAQQIAESVVGELIGRPGLDLTLVGPLQQIATDSSDRLTLESITGDTVVMDWREPDELIKTLAAIGFDGVRARHAFDPDAEVPAPGLRRIYAVNLNQFDDAGPLCKGLMEMLSDRQVKTVSLAMPGVVVTPKQSSQPKNNPTTKPQSPAKQEPLQSPAVNASPPTERRPAAPEIDLDDLVDQLDELDP